VTAPVPSARERRSSRHDVLLVIGILLLSGNPSIYEVLARSEVLNPVVAVLLALSLGSRGARFPMDRFLGISAGIVVILALQSFDFGFFPMVSVIGQLTRLFIGAAVVALVDDFPATYVRAMVAIALYTFVFYAIDQVTLALGIGFRDLFSPLEQWVGIDKDHRFSLVYTFTVYDGTHRCASFFREPGLYAGYLLFAILLLLLHTDAFSPERRKRYLIVLLIALATSFSTAGYVTAPLVLAVSGMQAAALRRVSGRGLFVGVLALGALVIWIVGENTAFIQQKIQHQDEAFLDEGHGFEITRFGAALLDLQAIEQRPLLGWGIHESTKFALTPDLVELAPSGGVTGWMRSFGLTGLALLVAAIWASMRTLTRGHLAATAYATFLVVLIAQPNAFLNYPLFSCLLFLVPPAPRPSGAPQLDEEVVAGAERVDDPRDGVIDPEPVERPQ
jgi:hypothetical protein